MSNIKDSGHVTLGSVGLARTLGTCKLPATTT